MNSKRHARLRAHQARRKNARKWRAIYAHRFYLFVKNYRASIEQTKALSEQRKRERRAAGLHGVFVVDDLVAPTLKVGDVVNVIIEPKREPVASFKLRDTFPYFTLEPYEPPSPETWAAATVRYRKG